MSNLADSSGWIEYLTKGSNAGFFLPALQGGQAVLAPTIAIYEVFKRMLVQAGEEIALQAIGVMLQAQAIDLTSEIAIEATQLSATLHLSMADAIILAASRLHAATLWTQDAHFASIEGVQFRAKPVASS